MRGVDIVDMLTDKILEERMQGIKNLENLKAAIRSLLKDWPQSYEPSIKLKEIKSHLEGLSS